MARGGNGHPKVSPWAVSGVAHPLNTPRRSPILPGATLRLERRVAVVPLQGSDEPEVTNPGTLTHVSTMGLFWIHSIFWAPPRPNYSTPCGWPSLDRPNGRSRDARPEGVIITYQPTVSCVLSI
jgi:hypothetical protein